MTGAREVLPMFPLGLVAFPGSVVPLRLFEPRYLALHEHLVLNDDKFGIVLIERGSAEAGGNDERFDLGTLMSSVRSAVLDDGTVIVIAVGQQRIRIHEWLEPDPFPRAVVERLDQPTTDPSTDALVNECRWLLHSVFEVASELGADTSDVDLTLAEDTVPAMYDIAHIAPLQEMDQQRILEQDDASQAAEILRTELHGLVEMLEFERNGR